MLSKFFQSDRQVIALFGLKGHYYRMSLQAQVLFLSSWQAVAWSKYASAKSIVSIFPGVTQSSAGMSSKQNTSHCSQKPVMLALECGLMKEKVISTFLHRNRWVCYVKLIMFVIKRTKGSRLVTRDGTIKKIQERTATLMQNSQLTSQWMLNPPGGGWCCVWAHWKPCMGTHLPLPHQRFLSSSKDDRPRASQGVLSWGQQCFSFVDQIAGIGTSLPQILFQDLLQAKLWGLHDSEK